MKVLHVTHGYFPEASGGIEAYLRMTAAAQQGAGCDVTILCGSMTLAPQCAIREDVYEGVRVLRLQRDDWYFDHYARSYHPGVSRLWREVLARERPDVVHLHQWIRLSSDLVSIAVDQGVPVVVTLHDVYTSCPRAFRVDYEERACTRELSVGSCRPCVPQFGHESPREIELGIELFRDQYRAELDAADRVLMAMGCTADLLHETTGVPRERFEVLALPYEPRFAGMAAPEGLSGAVRFGYWGSLTAHKGPQVLLRAMSEVVDRATVPVELHLLGPLGPDALRASLERQAKGLPVTFHGAFDAAQLRAAGIDVGVFPVLCYEAFGLGLAECFELGLPAIVSDIGALAERVGEAGLKVPPGDPVALAEAMLQLTHPGRRAERAQQVPPPPPDPATHAAALRAIYDEVRAGARRPAAPVPGERRAELLVLQRDSFAVALRDATGRREPR